MTNIQKFIDYTYNIYHLVFNTYNKLLNIHTDRTHIYLKIIKLIMVSLRKCCVFGSRKSSLTYLILPFILFLLLHAV